MGNWYFSTCVYQPNASQVQEAISSWLLRKGFELDLRQPLFAMEDSDDDRGVVPVTDRWTIVHYSHIGEFEDMVVELCRLGHPVLSCWLADSDVWGYELQTGREVVSAFNSNPFYWGQQEEPRGPNDIFALCKTLGIRGLETTIRSLQRPWRYVLFKEDLFHKFALVLGILPAASRYNYIEDGEDDFLRSEGTTVKYLWFRRAGRDPMARFDLHGLDVKIASPERWINQHVPGHSDEMYEHMRQEVMQRVQLMRLFLLPLRLLLFIMTLPLWARMLWYRLHHGKELIPPAPPWPMEGNDIINNRHNCRLTITGAQVGRYWQTGPSDVFAFDLDGVTVTCKAKRPHDVRRELLHLPQGCAFQEEDWWVRDMRARTVRYSCEGPQGLQYVVHHYVQGPRAVYVFSANPRQEPTAEFLAKLRTIVATLRFEPEPTEKVD